jgi:hypothetical protein
MIVVTDPAIVPSMKERVLTPITFSICGLTLKIYSGKAKNRLRKVTIAAKMAFQESFSKNPFELLFKITASPIVSADRQQAQLGLKQILFD